MSKTRIIFLVLVLSPLIAGLYGILNDQLSYTISEEYYTKFKFHQFGFAAYHGQTNFYCPRLLVCIVGFLATWWVGAIIGCCFCFFILVTKPSHMLLKNVIRAISVNMAIAFSFGITGLSIGYLLDETKFNFSYTLLNKSAFIMVGVMHTLSYIGGIVGFIFLLFYFKKQRKV